MRSEDNCNRELIFYYAGRADDPEEALRVAEAEIARRGDLLTRDAYAWALHRNGRSAEAWEQVSRALGLDTKDARILYHAGVIAAANGDSSRARELFEESLAANPRSKAADDARAALKRLAATPANQEGNQS
jgi:Flp pilus assembly protein TadD